MGHNQQGSCLLLWLLVSLFYP